MYRHSMTSKDHDKYLLEKVIINTNPPVNNTFIDHSGEIHDRLKILYYIGKDKHNHAFYMCHCDCGNNFITSIGPILAGKTHSCGCLYKEAIGQRSKSHGLTGTNIWYTWKNMTQRCYNSNRSEYSEYGSRGIYVCDEWLEKDSRGNSPGFLKFVNWSMENGYREGLTIDRIDVNGPYAPWNCRWVDNDIQANNKRNNYYIEYRGYNFPMSIWSKITGIPYDALRNRLSRKWSIEEALRTPVGYSRGNGYLYWEVKPEFMIYHKDKNDE